MSETGSKEVCRPIASFPDSQILLLAWESESLRMRRLLWYWFGIEAVIVVCGLGMRLSCFDLHSALQDVRKKVRKRKKATPQSGLEKVWL